MSNVIPFAAGGPPAIFQNRQSTLNQAAQQGVQASFAVIGYKGRAWSLKYRGDSQVLMNEHRQPLPNLDVVIVGVSPYISKQFYEKKFTEGSDEAPDCFSVDGITPDASSPKKQHATCAACPKNAWGSRVSEDGKKGKACQDSRRIAVVPAQDITNEVSGGPMMLRLPVMTLNNLATYAAMLERKGAGLEFVATRLGFDYDVAYPRITFEAIGWLSQEQAVEVVGADGNSGMCAHPLIERMLQEAAEPAPVAPAEPESALDQGAPAQVFAQPQPVAQPQPAVVQQVAPAPVQTVIEMPPPAAPVPVQQPVAAEAPAAPPQRKRAVSAFQTAPAAQPAPIQVAPVVQPVQQAAPTAPPTAIAAAPADMMSAIDDLLNAPA